MIIGLDLDNVLVDLNACEEAARQLGYKNIVFHIRNWELDGLPLDLKEKIISFFHDNDYMNKLSPIKGATKKLHEWKRKGHSLVIITARVNEIRKGTKEMVKRLFPMVDKLLFVDRGNSKRRTMREQKINIWIDDSPYGVIDSLGLGIPTFLISNSKTPYNKESRSLDGIIVATSIRDVHFPFNPERRQNSYGI